MPSHEPEDLPAEAPVGPDPGPQPHPPSAPASVPDVPSETQPGQQSEIRPGERQDELRVFDHGFVRLDASMADDLSVVNGARVSFAVRKEEMDTRDEGLIKFLMRSGHGCYDDATEVLTSEGWQKWSAVDGGERFATLSSTGELQYQGAIRLVRKEYRGPMIGFKGMSLDLLVTPDHRVLAAPMTTRPGRARPSFSLLPAHEVLWRSHRHITTATWTGEDRDLFGFDGQRLPAKPFLNLVGFFIGDGSCERSGGLVFHLHKNREISFLQEVVTNAGMELHIREDRYRVPLTASMRSFFLQCYDANREKVVPRRLLDLGTPLLDALLEGLIESDGSRLVRDGRSDKVSYHTTSRKLADAVQELALKTGRRASVRPHPIKPGDGHYGSKERWRVAIYNPRNSRPALCRTRAEADNQMGVESYDGLIHCVTVPNGTLFVRRNGYPVWSGNSPFEHNSFRFHIRCPIFVAREWFRHRWSSFNEESARYHQLQGDFYVPSPQAVRTQVGKPGAYTFEALNEDIAAETIATFRRVYDQLYDEYRALVDKGVAKELARSLLPFGIYTQFYWTLNARSLMNFLALRNSAEAQYEIRVYAQAVERLFAAKMPVTHSCFEDFGRRVP
jgi:thymidylate synthase (FAD)